MPLIALLDGITRVDATDPDDTLWRAVWRVSPRRDLTCRECGSRLDAVDRTGTRFFRHYRRVDCTSVGESPEHLRLKTLVAAAVRTAGWTALVEEPVPPRQADVLAVSSEGQRVAVEVQLSPQLAEDTAARTADYAAADVATLWVVHDPVRLGNDHGHVPRLVLDEYDRVTAPLLRTRATRDSVWDGQTHRRLDVLRWQQVDRTVQLDAMLTALRDERVVWSAVAGGWVPAHEVTAFDQAAAREAAERDEAVVARQELVEAKGTEQQRRLAEAAEQDPIGYATAVRVAEGLSNVGHSTPTILKGGNMVAYGWVVRTQATRVVIDPKPAHLRVWLRDSRRRRFLVQAEVDFGTTVASPGRHADLVDELFHLQHVDVWQPEPALLPSPDGGHVDRDLLEAARRIVAHITAAFDSPPPPAVWEETDQAWVWTLPDGATVALAHATRPEHLRTATGTHRVVLHLNRHVLPRDTDRRLIWRNLTITHLAAPGAV